MRVFFAILGGILGFVTLVLGLNALGFINYSFFAPRYTAVQNKVFQQSQQYNEGMVRDLEDIRRQYLTTTDPNAKDALRAIAIHRFEVYPIASLPPDLQAFYRSLNP